MPIYKHYIGKIPLTEYCRQNNISLGKIKGRMRYKGMTPEEAVNFVSNTDIFKEYRKKAKELGLSIILIKNRKARGLEIFAPVRQRTKYYHNGVSIHKILNCKHYQALLRYVTNHSVKESLKILLKGE